MWRLGVWDCENKREGGRKESEKPLNAPHTMLILPATLVHKLHNPKHVESDGCTSIPKTTHIIWPQSLLVVNLVKLHLNSFITLQFKYSRYKNIWMLETPAGFFFCSYKFLLCSGKMYLTATYHDKKNGVSTYYCDIGFFFYLTLHFLQNCTK